MEIVVFGIISLAAVALAVFFYLNSKQQATKLQETEAKLVETLSSLETEKRQNVVLETQLNFLKDQQMEDRALKEKNEAALKEQLELMGKEMILRGSQTLRSENQTQLSQFLQPFKEKLEAFEKEVKSNSQRETERHVNMETIIKGLSEQHLKMNNTAQNLADALRGNQKMQGDWGEMALERILEISGLQKGREYDAQSSLKDESGANLRPDVIVNLPENKHIIIDSKVSLLAFERMINAEEDTDQKIQLTAHIHSIKTHIKQLSEKNYTHLKGIDTPEFVLMFLPIESAFAMAMKEEPGLYQFAWEKRVVIVTPSTLLATLKTIESIWKQERQNRHALDIADQAGKLYDKFHGFISDMELIGKKQRDAQEAYDDAMKKLSSGPGNLIGGAEKLIKLGAKAKKQLDSKYFSADDNAQLEEPTA